MHNIKRTHEIQYYSNRISIERKFKKPQCSTPKKPTTTKCMAGPTRKHREAPDRTLMSRFELHSTKIGMDKEGGVSTVYQRIGQSISKGNARTGLRNQTRRARESEFQSSIWDLLFSQLCPSSSRGHSISIGTGR